MTNIRFLLNKIKKIAIFSFKGLTHTPKRLTYILKLGGPAFSNFPTYK